MEDYTKGSLSARQKCEKYSAGMHSRLGKNALETRRNSWLDRSAMKTWQKCANRLARIF